MLQVFVISPYFIFFKGILGFNHRWKSCKSIPFIGYNANLQVGLCPNLDANLINAPELLFLYNI